MDGKFRGRAGGTEGAGGTAAFRRGEQHLAGSEGTAEESRGEGGEGGAGKVASVVARVAASRVVTVAAPASGARRPGEGMREGERGSVSGEPVPRQEGWGLCRVAVSARSRLEWGPGGRVAGKQPGRVRQRVSGPRN